MKVKPTINNESARSGWTHTIEFSYKDIPAGVANNTTSTITTGLPAIPSGSIGWDVFAILVTPFANTADTALNTTTFSLGDNGSATRYINAIETNLNGSYVSNSKGASPVNNLYTSADQFKISIGSMTAKSVSNLNQGQIIVKLRLTNEDRPKVIDNTQP